MQLLHGGDSQDESTLNYLQIFVVSTTIPDRDPTNDVVQILRAAKIAGALDPSLELEGRANLIFVQLAPVLQLEKRACALTGLWCFVT